MNIIIFKNHNFIELFKKDNTERNIGYSLFNDVILTGRNAYYPNVLLYDNINTNTNNLISPYDEKVMSLNKDSFYDNNIFDISTINKINKNIITNAVFFFIYNFDNYYHFLYDTLPYLFTYLELKKNIHELKILVNYPNKNMKKFYKFNKEFLEKIINTEDLIMHSDNNIYKNIYISSSLTHGGFSNNSPRPEIFKIYKIISSKIELNKVNEKYKNLDKPLDKIYISRRTWINNDNSNIGTDYTSRRKMMNEDMLVENLVNNHSFTEIFTENLNTDEKIYLFSNAKIIIGAIGGGMSNLLFSNSLVKSILLVTPYFLDINYRFKYSIEHTTIIYFNDITTYLEDNKIPLYCRVIITNKESKYFNKCGEISEYNNNFNKYLVNISNNDVAGFNNSILFENELFNENEFKLLDKGLNSQYIVNLESLFVLL
jgi:capsular polysaccharide biosynthesis protein